MVLPFTQTTLNDAEKSVVMRAVAFQLSLPFDNVIEKKYDPSIKQPYASGNGKLALIISPLYTNPNFPDMLAHAAYLNTASAKSYIKKSLASYDDSQTLAISKYLLYVPYFAKVADRHQNAELVSQTATSLTFKVMLNNYGFVYGIAVPSVENGTSSIPSPYQIWRGFDSINAQAPNASVEVLQPNIDYTLTFDLLNASSTYDVYLTAGSNHPVYPDLLSGGSTVSIQAITSDSNVGDGESRSYLAPAALVSLAAILLAAGL